jgi:hypothetical protein
MDDVQKVNYFINILVHSWFLVVEIPLWQPVFIIYLFVVLATHSDDGPAGRHM